LTWPDAEDPSAIGSRKATTGDVALSGAHYCQDVALTAKRVSTNIGIIHDAGHAKPCEIAERFARDRRHVRRAFLPQHARLFSPLGVEPRGSPDIEPMFSDFKSRGFGIQETQTQYTDRLGRLILILSLFDHDLSGFCCIRAGRLALTGRFGIISFSHRDIVLSCRSPSTGPSRLGCGTQPRTRRLPKKKIGAAAQETRQRQALLVHARAAHSRQAYAPSPAAAKTLGVPVKLMDGEGQTQSYKRHNKPFKQRKSANGTSACYPTRLFLDGLLPTAEIVSRSSRPFRFSTP